jgi:hypothetical protein
LLEAFSLVDEEEDINKVTRYFSYEHFYVLYCRFWELDHDRDYRITREDLLKYGDHSLSHMVVDRIFDAAPRPFEQERVNREYLSYEDFIFFMLSGKYYMDAIYFLHVTAALFTDVPTLDRKQRKTRPTRYLFDIGSVAWTSTVMES